jgi:hypothetical protein
LQEQVVVEQAEFQELPVDQQVEQAVVEQEILE